MARYQLPALFLSASLAAVPAPTAAFISPLPLSTSSSLSLSLSSSSSSSCHRQIIFALHSSNSNSDSGSGSSGNNDDSLNSSGNFYNDFEEDLFTSSSSSSSSSASTNNNANKNKQPDRPSISKSSMAADYEYDCDSSFFESLQKRQAQLAKSSRELLDQWTKGSAETFAAFTINEQLLGGGTINPSSIDDRNGSDDDDDESITQLPFDYVRRISIGSYPRVACGSSCGSIYVADVESKTLLGMARDVHYSRHRNDDTNQSNKYNNNVDALDEKLKQCLYGDYDGGGVLAVAMFGMNLVASAGREGGVKLYQLVQKQKQSTVSTTNADGYELKYIGDVPSLKRPLPGVRPILVTCLKFDSLGRLFMGGQDGFLRMVTFELKNEDQTMKMDVSVISSPKQHLKQPPSSILSLDVSEELDMVATAHVNGNVCVYSMNDQHNEDNSAKNDDCLLGVWNPFSDTNNACPARSVAFISGGGSDVDEAKADESEAKASDNNNSNEQSPSALSWSIVVGGGNGELWMQEISPTHIPSSTEFGNHDSSDDTTIPTKTNTPAQQQLFQENSMQQIKPSHQGPVISLATRPGGILVSAGHDGMLRVSQLYPTPKALYGLGGYKVWIGNICIDSEGKRLLSDGRDDVVVVHDFSKEEKEPNL